MPVVEKFGYMVIGASFGVALMVILPMLKGTDDPLVQMPAAMAMNEAMPVDDAKAPMKIGTMVMNEGMAVGGVKAPMPMASMAMNESTADDDAKASMPMATMADHLHPPREVSPAAPVPGVSHLMFPDIMDGYNVQVLPVNFIFTPAHINRGAEDNEGHAHVYVNGMKIGRVYSAWFHLPGKLLQAGTNEVKITLNANDHSEWSLQGEPISSTVNVNVAK